MKKQKKRLTPQARKAQILTVALHLAKTNGYQSVSAAMIGNKLKISAVAILYHFKTMAQLRRAIMRQAVAEKNVQIVAQGLAANDPDAEKAMGMLRDEAMAATYPWQ